MKKLLNSTILATTLVLSAPAAFANAIATVNGVEIDKSELDRRINTLPQQILEANDETALRAQITQQLVQQELLRQQAKKEKLFDEADFKARLSQLKDNLTFETLVNRKVAQAVTPETVQARYEAVKEQIARPRVHARHILVEDEKTAEKLIRSIDDGKDFEKSAKKYSVGPSKESGGDLGWFQPGQMVKEFSDAAFAMEKGDISKQPVKTQFGYHVIYIEDKQDKYIPSFEEVQQELVNVMRQEAVNAYITGLKEAADIKIN